MDKGLMMNGNPLMGFSELAEAIGARLISLSGPGEGGFYSAALDSRAVEPGALFVALPGSCRDGHCYVEAAFRGGAAAALVEESRLGKAELALEETARRLGKTLLVVEDTLRAFQDAAAAYLKKFPRLLRIGITGSAGKTTTKEAAAAMAAAERPTVTNPGNLNSETGLPLAVFSVREHHRVGIFEMGMNRRGEIGELARVLRPQIALITNIGSAHVGILGSKDAIAEEKKAIFSRFTGEETALIPEDEEYRAFLSAGVRGRVRFFGRESFPELSGVRDLGLEGTELTWEGLPVRFGLPGKHHLRNALAALAIAREIPLGAQAVRRGLQGVRPLFGRGEILRGAVTVVQDCYNANPESVLEALAFCDGLPWPGRRVYVIGSMLELGEESAAAHERIGRVLASSGADRIFLFGAETRGALGVLERVGEGGGRVPACFHTNYIDVLSQAVADYVAPGDLVLLKGSRGCALERLTEVLLSIPASEGVTATAWGGVV
ncbi:MAG: UDP-N-acetylmuramoyl-tripeptide--D-alanyl-D-alanine ligase [Spirochaetaceae bacterium]|jgi:UDP-N-acetylmuramoyl-tripeptide--D-alanyl-D-alanine ligase|nr:UDP-N-acetylmuramoyl-tripeptide--D-alanyl-D-alanine ligase [Spirochaetaceae bacterium]